MPAKIRARQPPRRRSICDLELAGIAEDAYVEVAPAKLDAAAQLRD